MPEPEAGAVAVAEPDTATPTGDALPADTPAESTPTDTEIVEGQPGDEAADGTPTPGDEPAEEPGEKAEASDESLLTPEEKKLGRRERERIAREKGEAKRLADARAAWEREEQAKAEATRRQQEAAEAQRKRAERLQQYVGVPDAEGKPGTISTLRSEVDALNRQIREELVNPRGADLDELTRQVNEKEARVERLTENSGMAAEIEGFVWDQIEADFMSAAGFPEFADDKARDTYRRHPGGIRGALAFLAQTIRSAKDAEWQGKLTESEKAGKARLDAMTSDRNAWRARAGGSEDAPADGGRPSPSAGIYTRARLAEMLRTPEGLTEYHRNRAEIERQAAAGQIR